MTARPIDAAEASVLFKSLGRSSHLAVAVSGGADSLALLHLLARWRDAGGVKPGLTALTVDHRLRDDSAREAEMVASVAQRLGVGHAVLAWEEPHADKGGVQKRARAARYDLMAAYCHAKDIPALITAHHLDDQAETFLMRLKRGSGLDGLAAIPDESVWAGMSVHRPLLGVSKARLVATLEALGASWAEDPSNEDARFERVRVRAERDAFAKLGLSPEALARSAKRLRRARAALEGSADDFLAAHAAVSEAGFCTLAAAALDAAPEEIALRVLARVLAAVGGRAEPIRLSKLESLFEALGVGPGKAHTLGGCRLEHRAGQLRIYREARGTGLPEIVLEPGEQALWDNRFRVALAATESAPAVVRAFGASPAEIATMPRWLADLPRFARITLPICARGEALILPTLGATEVAADGFRANFVAARGVSTRPEGALKEACTSFG